MPIVTDRPTDPQATAWHSPGRSALALWLASILCVVGGGLLMWWRHGAAVFNDTVLAALAWCF